MAHGFFFLYQLYIIIWIIFVGTYRVYLWMVGFPIINVIVVVIVMYTIIIIKPGILYGWLAGWTVDFPLSLSLCIYVSLFLWSRRCSIYHCYLIIFWNTHTRINSGNRNGGFELACLEQSNKTVIIIVHKGDTHNVETDRPTGPNRSACFFFVFLLLPPHHSRIPPLSNTSIFNGSNTPSPSQRVYMIQIKTFEMKNFFSV